MQAEKYYIQRRLDRVQQRFRTLIKGIQNRVDLDFATYLKEKVACDIDISMSCIRTEIIIKQKEIRNQKELKLQE